MSAFPAKNIVNNLSNRVYRLLRSRVGFWSSKTYDLTTRMMPESRLKEAEDGQSKQILIVGREHYHETVQDYPVGDAKDLKHILSQRSCDSPFSGQRYTVIERLNQSSHRVTSWVVNERVFTNLSSRPWFIIPESACVRALHSSKAVLVSRAGKSVLTVDSSSGLFSTVLSSSNEIQSHTSLRHVEAITGVSSKQWRHVDAEDFSQHVFDGMVQVLLKFPLRFLVPFKFNSFQVFPWKASLKTLSAIFSVYTLGIFLYLSLSLNWVDYRLAELKLPAEEVVALRGDIVNGVQMLEAHNSIITDLSPNWMFWDLFIDLKKQGVQLTRVNGDNQVIVVYGLAQRASEVLVALSADARVKSAEYANSVRKKGVDEQFSISIELKNKLTLPAGSESIVASKQDLVQ